MAKKTRLVPDEIVNLLMDSPVSVCEWMQRGMLHVEVLGTDEIRPFGMGDIARFARDYGLQFNRPDRGSLRILIVNDDVQAAHRLVQLLDTLTDTAESMAVHSTYEAGRKIPGFHPDVVLVDLKSPYQDTLEICRQIKSDHANSNVMLIAVTDAVDLQQKQRMLMVGVDVCLERPLSSQRLLDVLGLYLEPVRESQRLFRETHFDNLSAYIPVNKKLED